MCAAATASVAAAVVLQPFRQTCHVADSTRAACCAVLFRGSNSNCCCCRSPLPSLPRRLMAQSCARSASVCGRNSKTAASARRRLKRSQAVTQVTCLALLVNMHVGMTCVCKHRRRLSARAQTVGMLCSTDVCVCETFLVLYLLPVCSAAEPSGPATPQHTAATPATSEGTSSSSEQEGGPQDADGTGALGP